MNIEELIAKYPKIRPELPDAYRKRYVSDYQDNRSGKTASFAKTLESWMHRQVAKASQGSTILELGGGNLNHLQFESAYETYDVVEPFEELWRDSPQLDLVGTMYTDIRSIEPAKLYSKILSIAVLEHLVELPFILARSGLLLAEGGTFCAGIPTEGALAWYCGWKFGTGIPYQLRTGLDYSVLMKHEHVNNATEITELVRYFFKDVELSRFPLPIFHGSFYTCLTARNPRLDLCRRHGL